ncbi:MAG TPA: trypsin-like peptidase domain-containing protein [Candidatus Avacidaminococcus intestinavium]|uniref:Trypsin-like peptidase domain-containing protein n=1 Tax=Candidatus Avacidaminococcus intestinavium TaxID=2840684 RepID=A0A9D1MP97_9FIRM|nr:trypsin-like peptidase domain-containing protein [Candidatus Avacidaminococcus intestinavium]
MMLGVVLVVGGCAAAKTHTPNISSSVTTPVLAADPSGARNTPVVKVAKDVGPAVVGITNKALVRDFFNRVQLTERGTGSGVIYDKSGLIVTNNHVVEGAQEIVVSLSDGRSVPGRVLGVDAATDLAVVKIDADNLTVATFGDSDQTLVGEPAIAIGNPLGLEFRGSVTVGVISALNRSIDLGERRFKLIQTDAAINPGNSGGALVNADGEVIGINSAKIAVSGVEGIGFAIPINSAKPIIADLEKQGRVIRPYIGASLLDKEIAERYGIDIDLHDGIYVLKIAAGGPAWKAGIRTNDIILKFDGAAINLVSDLRDRISNMSVGEKVKMEILRGDEKLTFNLTLEEMPAQ